MRRCSSDWRRGTRRSLLLFWLIIAASLMLDTACAHIEPERFAVSRLKLEGMHALDAGPLRDCLLTRERGRFTLRLGPAVPQCSEPPFTSSPPALQLWSWGWTEWPSFNRSVFERDRERILRWYRARGFYAARVEAVDFDPPEAGRGGTCRSESCAVTIRVLIAEGEPVLVESIDLSGLEVLPPELRNALRARLELHVGQRFDEVDYDRTKRALLGVLRDHAFAAASIDGKVSIAEQVRRARVRFEITPGAPYAFGTVELSGQGSLPAGAILGAAGQITGQPYRPARIEEMRVEVLALGAFSAVDVTEQPDAADARMNIALKVTPLQPRELRLGVGLTSGANQRNEAGDLESVPQWDTHLFGRYEMRQLAGTLGSLVAEDSPRLIYAAPFPELTSPSFGNIVSLKLDEPALIEARTDLMLQSTWDYGPDPYLGFRRSDISVRLSAKRGFFSRRLLGSVALQQDIFVVPDDTSNTTSDGSPTPSTYKYAFLEQNLSLDLRNQPIQPRYGAYFAVKLAESLRSFASDWSSLRVMPEARGYLPLPLSSVLALRAAIGAILIFDAKDSLDDLSRELGPSNYRLRGGGANSVRGFQPGELGVGTQGGVRRWESMLEWRLRIGADLTLVAFLDAGDVNDQPSFRFGHLNTSAGLGFRYYTLLGPIRMDAGFRIVEWQRADGSAGIEEGASTFPLTNLPGALHLTIGDSF
jgi:outer membrane translocation and assembly module TamA